MINIKLYNNLETLLTNSNPKKIIKRNNNGKSVIIYEGKYQKTIYDNTVVDGQTYEYSVTPVYQGRAGEPVPLPSVHIQTQKTPPADWWND